MTQREKNGIKNILQEYGHPNVTQREQEVLNLLKQGRADKEIAQSLRISVRTVRFHVTNLFLKWNVSSRAELMAQTLNETMAKIAVP